MTASASTSATRTREPRPKWTLEATFAVERVPNAAVTVLNQNHCSIGPAGRGRPGTFHVVALL